MISLRLLGAATALAALGTVALPGAVPGAGAAVSACTVASVALVDQSLGIDAAHVNAGHPAKPVGALICSYYGNSGQSANEATINYLPASTLAFAAVEASLAKSYSIRTIGGIKSGAYSYDIGSERFLYVLDGDEQLQMFAYVPLVRLERLARAMPILS